MNHSVLARRDPAVKNALKWVKDNPGIYELLGHISDEEVAERFDCKINRVRRYRRALGIRFKRGRKSQDARGGWVLDSKHPELSSSQIEDIIYNIDQSRRDSMSEKYEEKYPKIFEVLGKITDQAVGDSYGISRETVRLIRNKFDIQTMAETRVIAGIIDTHSLVLTKEVAQSLLTVNRFINANIDLIYKVLQSDEGGEE